MSNFNIENRLEQKQILLPSLILEMKLISMNLLELDQYIKEKSEENPFIEYEENQDDFITYLPKLTNTTNISSSELIDKTSHQFQTLYEYFNNELNLIEIPSEEIEYALLLVPYLSENGMLKEKLEEISKKLNFPYHLLENGKICISSIDSKGYCSESFKEMVLTQVWLSENKESEYLFDTLFNYYDLIINKNFTKLNKIGFSNKEIDKIIKLMMDIIHIPPPIIENNEGYIIPDAVIKIENGKVNFKILEPFKFSFYKYQFKDLSDESKKLYDEAKNLNQALNLRKSAFETFLKYFVIFQQEFFFKGEKYIQPITQKEFAKKIDISESTLSRIVNNKYIDTPFGIYPLKFFFSSSYSKKKGRVNAENVQSRNQIINMIKEIIKEEDTEKPFSDQQIVEILRKKGYYISRRTSSKYREIAGIPPKNLRKGVKKVN